MGQGGFITLVNGTKHDWIPTDQRSYQMETWSFPSIPAGKTAKVYVEWEQGIFINPTDDSGDVTYRLKGTDYAFTVNARAKSGFNLSVAFTNLATQGNASGTVLNLGWIHDGTVVFVLAGTAGNFFSTNPPVAWMQNNLNVIGSRVLRQICLPGSHDTGMSVMNGGTAGAFSCNVLTQRRDIAGQLIAGARYFDIRPVISAGKYLTGHYSKIGPSWQGANGQAIASIIEQINAFTASNRELVILNLSHDLNTDIGNFNYRPFDQQEWNALFSLMSDLQGLFVAPAGTFDLTKDLVLSQFIGQNRAAVVVVVDPSQGGINLGRFEGRGFYPRSAFPIFDNYSNTNDLNKMVGDQIEKMRRQRPSPSTENFLLSWTLTQDAVQASTCFFGTADSILILARAANSEIYLSLLPQCSPSTYPNVLYIDDMSSSNMVALAMSINTLGSPA